ncbi:thermonuclease family protein [Mesorhizobium sp. 10.2.3]|uniref:thermonuclease family protein n=1 Tax=Mesorhizobium sp. 10.2.3 TaxID=1085775 RepID=UPI0010A968E6|nr:thermonuclease family protein [Mesorhizobium sp. 10.2.3]
MGGPGRSRLAIALGSLLLLAGVLLIIQARALLSVDRPVLAPSKDVDGMQPIRPVAPVADAQRREPARKVAQDLIAPPRLDPAEIERAEPRPPLSELGLAVPLKTPLPEDWREVLLYRPVATSSAMFESMGRKVVISGVQGIDLDRSCSFHEVSWPCGQRARAAFNSWLRGRGLKCSVPPAVERFAIAAPCSLGKQDVGAWLVSNGWATALPSGIYGKAEATARNAQMGIFGPAQ